MSKNDFQRVLLEEKQIILESVVTNSIELVVKGSADQIFRYKAISLSSAGLLSVVKADLIEEIPSAERALVNFNYKGRRYFFQTKLFFKDAEILFGTGEDFYSLQQRQHPRLEIKSKVKGLFIISTHQSLPIFIQAQVIDFGLGGLRIQVNEKTPHFKMLDQLTGFLEIEKNFKIKLTGNIRHINSTEQQIADPQIFGIQFLNLTTSDQNRLESMFMKLQIQLFEEQNTKV